MSEQSDQQLDRNPRTQDQVRRDAVDRGNVLDLNRILVPLDGAYNLKMLR